MIGLSARTTADAPTQGEPADRPSPRTSPSVEETLNKVLVRADSTLLLWLFR